MSDNRLALLDRAQSGDSDACEKMLMENSGLIWSVVRRYYGLGADPEDLYQLGCIGFIKAVKGFDITYGTQFFHLCGAKDRGRNSTIFKG